MIQRFGRPGVVGAACLSLAGSAVAQCDWREVNDGVNGTIFAMTVFDDGIDEGLYCGGIFTEATSVVVSNIAWWDGGTWSSVGDGLSGEEEEDLAEVYALAVYDDGGGAALYAGGIFNLAGMETVANVAKWDGFQWSALGDGVAGDDEDDPAYVYAMAVFNGELYVGGDFTMAGGAPARNIAKWDGAAWSAVGMPVDGVNRPVRCMTVWDDGSGEALYVGGQFSTAGGSSANGVAKWDGSEWSRLRGAMNGPTPRVNALAVYDDMLYAGGQFDTVDGDDVNNIARWDGSRWSAVGDDEAEGTDGMVNALAVFEDLVGDPSLYAGGEFTEAGGAEAFGIARWDGEHWGDVDNGVVGTVNALATFDDGSRLGNGLYAGGSLSRADTVTVANIARLYCRPASIATLNRFRITRGEHIRGNRARVIRSDNRRYKAMSNDERDLFINATFSTILSDVRDMRLTFESSVDEPAGRAEILLKNWSNGKWQSVGEFAPVSAERTSALLVDRAQRFVNDSGKIKMQIRYEVWVSQKGGPFTSQFDLVRTLAIE